MERPGLTHGLEESLADCIQVDERNLLFGCDFAHCLWVTPQCLQDFTIGVEAAAVHRRDQDQGCTMLARLQCSAANTL